MDDALATMSGEAILTKARDVVIAEWHRIKTLDEMMTVIEGESYSDRTEAAIGLAAAADVLTMLIAAGQDEKLRTRFDNDGQRAAHKMKLSFIRALADQARAAFIRRGA